MTEMCRMRSSSSAASLAGSSVAASPGRFWLPSWWWMWKSRVPFSSHCCRHRTSGMSSEFPEISAQKQKQKYQLRAIRLKGTQRRDCTYKVLSLEVPTHTWTQLSTLIYWYWKIDEMFHECPCLDTYSIGMCYGMCFSFAWIQFIFSEDIW